MKQPNRRSRRAIEPVPLDRAAIEGLALAYAARYLTSRGRLTTYLNRKLRERGGPEDAAAIVADVVERVAAKGFVDDRAFAGVRAADHARRGLGAGRLRTTLRFAGIGDEDAADVLAVAEEGAWEAALAFARRRRLGRFGAAPDDPATRRRGFAAMLRAGHRPDLAARVLAIDPDEAGDDTEPPMN